MVALAFPSRDSNRKPRRSIFPYNIPCICCPRPLSICTTKWHWDIVHGVAYMPWSLKSILQEVHHMFEVSLIGHIQVRQACRTHHVNVTTGNQKNVFSEIVQRIKLSVKTIRPSSWRHKWVAWAICKDLRAEGLGLGTRLSSIICEKNTAQIPKNTAVLSNCIDPSLVTRPVSRNEDEVPWRRKH